MSLYDLEKERILIRGALTAALMNGNAFDATEWISKLTRIDRLIEEEEKKLEKQSGAV